MDEALRQLETYARTHYQAGFFDPDEQSDSPLAPLLILSLMSTNGYIEQSLTTQRPNATRFRTRAAFVDSFDINAFATAQGDMHLCGTHSGLAVFLLKFSMFVMVQPDTFAAIGNPAAEVPSKIVGADPLETFRANNADTWFVPENHARKEFAEDLAQLLLRYVWFHEMYHCLNGHVGFLQQFDQHATLHEFPAAETALVRRLREATSSLPPDTRQLMELDADRTALWACFKVQMAGMENIPSIAERSLEQRLHLTLFSACLMTVLFNHAAHRADGSDPYSHPRAEIRLHNFIRTVASQLADKIGDVRPLFLSVMRDMHVLRRCFPSLPDIEALYADLMSPETQAPMDAAEEWLDEARKQWKPFAYTQLELTARVARYADRKMCVVVPHLLAREPAARSRCIPPALVMVGVEPHHQPKRIAV